LLDFYQPHDSVLHTTVIDQTQQQMSSSQQEQQEQQQQALISTPTPISSPKSQPSSNSNNNHHHQKHSHRRINTNGRYKSPAFTSNNSNQIKLSPIRHPPPVPPRPSPTTLTEIHVNETTF
jgi:hypothetical protein